MEQSLFYQLAKSRINEELTRLDRISAALDQNPEEKKKEIATYKCAKYRWAGISNIDVMLYNCHRLKRKMEATCYLIPYVYEIFSQNERAMAFYRETPDARKPDAGLYLGILVFAQQLIAEKQEKMKNANDWERLELTTYLEGHLYVLNILKQAWKESGGEYYDLFSEDEEP